MGQEMFSATLKILTGFQTENPALQDSLSFLQSLVGEQLRVLDWGDGRIAIPVTVAVELPSIANYDNIDIRAEEAILIVFDKKDYPAKAPLVFTDRLDFPKTKLAHLYIALEGRTPGFCYVRGDKDQWYANKTIKDLLVRIQNWLRDAATGNLTEDGNQFEPLRLEGYSGIVVYDYDFLADVVRKNQRVLEDLNFAIGLFERIKDEDVVSFRLLKLVTPGTITEIMVEFEEEKKKDEQNAAKRSLHFGYILWSDNQESYGDYNIVLPNTWSQFKSFCEAFGIDCQKFEDFVCSYDGNYFVHFPVIAAIRRPKQLIGYSAEFEFVNFRFRVDTADVKDGKFASDFKINFQAHNQPLTIELARRISNTQPSPGVTLIFGCGALGSKIGLHFGRSGNHNLRLYDPDILSSHNMVRHALLADKIGVNKAKALTTEVKSMFPSEQVEVEVGRSSLDFSSAEAFKEVSRIFDFTASPAFFNKLVSASTIDDVAVSNSSISDFGNLGLTLIEGENRNPRVDDLQVSLYALHDVNENIKSWLQREQAAAEKENVTVRVGVGCNSETTILSDINVSSHAAFAAGVLEREVKDRKKHGSIFINRIVDSPVYSIETENYKVQPFDVFRAVNDQTWAVRFSHGIVGQMRKEMIKSKRKETGGVFVGVANYKTKTIHVTNLIPAPPDSKANSVCFYRGVNGLPSTIETISKSSGGQLGYIGEWHSHPHGPDGLSNVDLASVERFKSEFESLTTPLPVFLTVITPTAFLPFVF